jgi:hypothetical protein
MHDIDDTLGHFANFIEGVVLNTNNVSGYINGDGHDYFKEIGSFNIQTIVAEVSEYATSFEKLITSFNNDFYKIFIVDRHLDYSEKYAEKIEKCISYVSSIEVKLKECSIVDTCKSRNGDTTSSPKSQKIATTENIPNNQIDYLNPNDKGDDYYYQSIVFVILSTFLNGVGVNKVLGYSKKVIEEIKIILNTKISCKESEKKTFLNNCIPNGNSTLFTYENIGHISDVSEFYHHVINIYNHGIHKIGPNNESYRLKCQLKQRINLLKFIVRNHTFMTYLKLHSNENVMNLAILNNSKVEVLKAKLIALTKYTNDMGNNGYYALQTQFGSPTKTPNSSQDEEVPTTQSLLTEPSDDVEKPSDDVDEILHPLDDSEQDEPSEEENINNTIFDNFYSKVTLLFVSFYKTNKVFPVETQVGQIVNDATGQIKDEIQQPTEHRPTEDQPTKDEKRIAIDLLDNITTNRNNTTASIISWIVQTLSGYLLPSGSKVDDSGGSRKKYKKTKKFTRRKNKKSPKRKTIKKRKMPKRNAKTRRQRK